MYKGLLGLLILFSSVTFAADANIKCYHNGKVIYSGMGYDIYYSDNVFSFIEDKTNRIVFVRADCVISV